MIRVLVISAAVCSLALGRWMDMMPRQRSENAPQYLSPQALVVDESANRIYVAAATEPRLVVVDLAAERLIERIVLPGPASGLALAPESQQLYVTTTGAEGKVYLLDVPSGQSKLIAEVGHSPASPVLSQDGKLLYVCNQYNHNVAVVNLVDKKVMTTIPVVREPIAADLTPDGSTLIVANHLPKGPSDVEHVAATISIIDTKTNTVSATILLPNGSIDMNGLCISGDGRYAYVTHILSRHHLPTTQIERGWINTNALTIIDIQKKQWLNTVLLDDVDRGAANPWGIQCTDDDTYLVVNLSGTHELCVIDRPGLHAKLDKVAAGEKVSPVASTPEEVRNDLSFLVDLKRRIKLPGTGPRGLAISGTRAFSAEYFTDSLSVVDLPLSERAEARSIRLQRRLRLTDERKGEILFHDATICFQQWQSCTSCHPDSGRADALNWDLLNDGIGNPKNTKSMVFAHMTPPVMSLGVREDAKVAVRAGLERIQFAVRPEEEADAIDTYLKSLRPMPSPYLVNGELSESAKRGEILFTQTGCIRCHHGPMFTDLKPYNVSTKGTLDRKETFDTPTLLEVWRTGPYLHDGRAVTIQEVLTKYNNDDQHGHTSNLTDEQIQDLAHFVLSN